MKSSMEKIRTEFMDIVGSISVAELISNKEAVLLIEDIYEELTLERNFKNDEK